MEHTGWNIRKPIVITTALLLVIAAGQVGSHLIMGGSSFVQLSPAPALLGQAIQTSISGTGKTLSTAGYSLGSTHYFDNGAWVVTKVTPPNDGQTNTVVMQKAGKFYHVVLGPGTIFPNNATLELPNDVIQYLSSQRLIYNAG